MNHFDDKDIVEQVRESERRMDLEDQVEAMTLSELEEIVHAPAGEVDEDLHRAALDEYCDRCMEQDDEISKEVDEQIIEYIDGEDLVKKDKDLKLYKTDGYKGPEGWPKPTSSSTSPTQVSLYEPPHKHPPFEALIGPKKVWSVWVGKCWDCDTLANNFDLVINLTGTSIKSNYKGHIIPIPELEKWQREVPIKFTEMLMNWPDMGVVNLPFEFWDELISYIEKNKLKVLLFCVGGHGRTGTALACLMIAALGWDAKKAKQWIWDNYCERAIETKSQEDYIDKIYAQYKAKHSKQ